MVQKYTFGKEKYTRQINDIQSDVKRKTVEFHRSAKKDHV